MGLASHLGAWTSVVHNMSKGYSSTSSLLDAQAEATKLLRAGLIKSFNWMQAAFDQRDETGTRRVHINNCSFVDVRGLAHEFNNLISFRAHELYAERLLKHLTSEPPIYYWREREREKEKEILPLV